MPKKITDSETGEEMEVFSPEEIEEREVAAKEAAVEQYKTEHPDNSEEIEKLQEELKTATEELGKEKNKDKNFGKLREAKEEIEKKLADAIGGVEKKFEDRDLSAAIGSLTNGDDELAKKAKHHFEKTLAAVVTKTPEEFAAKVQDAMLLARGPQGGGTGGAFHSGGAGMRTSKPVGEPLSAAAAEVAKKMGITAEDAKKYGGTEFSKTA